MQRQQEREEEHKKAKLEARARKEQERADHKEAMRVQGEEKRQAKASRKGRQQTGGRKQFNFEDVCVLAPWVDLPTAESVICRRSRKSCKLSLVPLRLAMGEPTAISYAAICAKLSFRLVNALQRVNRDSESVAQNACEIPAPVQ